MSLSSIFCFGHSGFFPHRRPSAPGVLIDAMRKGYWIILDELNLAPTDVLEALNRLLDDNRELFVAETQEVIRAHPRFMLFATQNPPGLYGGRKVRIHVCFSAVVCRQLWAAFQLSVHKTRNVCTLMCTIFSKFLQ